MEILKTIKRHIYLLIIILVAVYLIIDMNTRLSTLAFLENQEATLQELGELMDPPVGKSGVNHRLRRISAIAEKLRSVKGGKPDDEGQCYDPSAQWT